MKWLGVGVAGAAGTAALTVTLPLLALAAFSPAGAPLDPSKVPAEYVVPIQQAAAACDGLPAAVLAAQLHQESGWDPRAVSPAGAVGLAQFLPATWIGHGIDGNGDGRADPRDPIDAIWSAAVYDCELKQQVSAVPGEPLELTLAAYNAGPYAVLEHQGVPPLPETRAYVDAILQAAPSYVRPTGGGGDGLVPAAAHVRNLVIENFGVTDIGGYASSGHIPGSDHYTGHAIDIMLTPMGPSNTQLGWQIALYLESNARQLGIKYLIWQAQIWSLDRASEGWRTYSHPGGGTSPTELHMDHVHVSVY